MVGAIPVDGDRVLLGRRRYLSHENIFIGKGGEEEDRTCNGNLPVIFPLPFPFVLHSTDGNLKSQAM